MSEVPNRLTLFFDSTCPLCVAEMQALQSLNSSNLLLFEDIHSDQFCERFPDISQTEASNMFHGRYENGDMIFGLDVSVQAWNIVGKHRWLGILRAPGIRLISDMAYRFFARYRSLISLLLTGRRKCESCETIKTVSDDTSQNLF